MTSSNPRGGRPRIPNPKSRRINVRFAEAEHAVIERQAAAAGVSASEYLRMSGLGAIPRVARSTVPALHIEPGLFHELRRQGVNLHQIVKHLNIHQTPPGAFEADIRELLSRIRGIINRVAPP